VTWPPPSRSSFDAVEVLAGYTAFNVRRPPFDDGARDFYTLVYHGHLIARSANSDTHDLNWVSTARPANYVYVDDPRRRRSTGRLHRRDPRPPAWSRQAASWLDVEAAASRGATADRRPGQALSAAGTRGSNVTVSQAPFVHVERIRITIGGGGARRSRQRRRSARRAQLPLDRRDRDRHRYTWIGVTADGRTPAGARADRHVRRTAGTAPA